MNTSEQFPGAVSSQPGSPAPSTSHRHTTPHSTHTSHISEPSNPAPPEHEDSALHTSKTGQQIAGPAANTEADDFAQLFLEFWLSGGGCTQDNHQSAAENHHVNHTQGNGVAAECFSMDDITEMLCGLPIPEEVRPMTNPNYTATSTLPQDITAIEDVFVNSQHWSHNRSPTDNNHRASWAYAMEGDGITNTAGEAVRPRLCIDYRKERDPDITFDVDSISGFLPTLAAIKAPLVWFPTSNPSSSITHDNMITLATDNTTDAPINKVPHFEVGELQCELTRFKLYCFLPALHKPNAQLYKKSNPTDPDRLRRVIPPNSTIDNFTDQLFIPAIREAYQRQFGQHNADAILAHLPTTASLARAAAQARHEGGMHAPQEEDEVDHFAEQSGKMSVGYPIQASVMPAIQEGISSRLHRQGAAAAELQGLRFYVQCINTKLSTMMPSDSNVSGARSITDYTPTLLSSIFHLQELDKNQLYIDIGKQQTWSARNKGSDDKPHVLLYRRCCLKSINKRREAITAKFLQQQQARLAGQHTSQIESPTRDQASNCKQPQGRQGESLQLILHISCHIAIG